MARKQAHVRVLASGWHDERYFDRFAWRRKGRPSDEFCLEAHRHVTRLSRRIRGDRQRINVIIAFRDGDVVRERPLVHEPEPEPGASLRRHPRWRELQRTARGTN